VGSKLAAPKFRCRGSIDQISHKQRSTITDVPNNIKWNYALYKKPNIQKDQNQQTNYIYKTTAKKKHV
jgi:hypothetical protein